MPHTWARRRAIWLMLVTALAAGCGTSSPSSPLAVSGPWAGTMHLVGTPIDVQMTFTQTDTSLSGTWTLTGPAGSASGRIISGFVASSGSVTFAAVIDGEPSCVFSFETRLKSNGSRLDGTYINFGCALFSTGMIEIRRQ